MKWTHIGKKTLIGIKVNVYNFFLGLLSFKDFGVEKEKREK